MTELAGDVHRVWELQTWSRDESPWSHRRESGERTEKMTTTLQTVHHVCAMCVWSNMSISNRPLQPPAHSSSIDLLIIIIIIILDDSDHHTRSRGIAREREIAAKKTISLRFHSSCLIICYLAVICNIYLGHRYYDKFIDLGPYA